MSKADMFRTPGSRIKVYCKDSVDILPSKIRDRERNELYSCPKCSRCFVVYKGRVECTCEAQKAGRRGY